jgi:uncharacterized secreted repeat protein (TIGR03808 family)
MRVSAIRGNSASNIQIIGNTVHQAGEVALYSEFGFEGAIIAHNMVDGAQTGISVANFNEGGRLAVVQGNILRNLKPKDPDPPPGDLWGVGIYVEADTAVSANVVENARDAGIAIGWGSFLRDVAVTGNVVRQAPIGIAVSVVPGAGSALISANVVTAFGAGRSWEWTMRDRSPANSPRGHSRIRICPSPTTGSADLLHRSRKNFIDDSFSGLVRAR